MSAFNIIHVDSWARFYELTAGETYRSWAFRGQADATWPLFSTISRYLLQFRVHRDAWAEQERRILRVFQRKAHLHLASVPAENDEFQWLALMQHHGAPTRLLDFTWSPFVAAFFALERAVATSAVWAVCMPRVREARRHVAGRRKSLGHDELALHTPGNYERYFIRNDASFVYMGEPFVMNQRLVAQAGTFIVPGELHDPLETILSTYPDPAKVLAKFELDTTKIRDEAMRALYNMNISNATLFPGLDGMARSLAFELEFHWSYDPKTMNRFPGFDL